MLFTFKWMLFLKWRFFSQWKGDELWIVYFHFKEAQLKKKKNHVTATPGIPESPLGELWLWTWIINAVQSCPMNGEKVLSEYPFNDLYFVGKYLATIAILLKIILAWCFIENNLPCMVCLMLVVGNGVNFHGGDQSVMQICAYHALNVPSVFECENRMVVLKWAWNIVSTLPGWCLWGVVYKC